MRIFDCFMFFDEEIVLDLRLNTLSEYVDYFVIVESKFTHKGEKRKLKFDINKFKSFKEKIIYLVHDKMPEKIENIHPEDSENKKKIKYIYNAVYRENDHRNYIMNGLKLANDNDIILISDLDEIPNLSKVSFKNIKEKIIFFRQDMFYYKFNLKLPGHIWIGTKACRKKDLKSPQWLRNIKDRKYSIFRLDIMFSNKKYHSVKILDNGGWHFSNIKSPEDIEYKLRQYLHHREFDEQPLTTDEIKKIIDKKQAIYDLRLDKRINKIGSGDKLVLYPFDKLPLYLQKNKELYTKWLD